LSEYDVPDDDMPDSLPPDGGPDPYDGWDQEGLLSGESVWLPDGMRPVAATLAALRGAPMRAELADEAAARAAFREIMLAGQSGPGWPGAVGDGHTLILPARAADGGPPGMTRRPHSHRRPPQRGRWRSKALAGAAGAAAVVVVGGVALAGVFSSAGGHPGQPGHSADATSATTSASHPVSNGLDGSATKEPTAHPTPSNYPGGQSADGPDAAALCRQYLAFLTHPESASDWANERGTIRQLSELADGSRHIVGYCINLQQPWAMTPKGPGSDLGGPGLPPSSDSPGSDDPQGPQDANRPDHVGNGLGGSDGNGSGRSGDSSDFGGQGQN
jgi:hypothetical protein